MYTWKVCPLVATSTSEYAYRPSLCNPMPRHLESRVPFESGKVHKKKNILQWRV